MSVYNASGSAQSNRTAGMTLAYVKGSCVS